MSKIDFAKKVIKHNINITGTDVYVCYGDKAFEKTFRKQFGIKGKTFTCGGVCSAVDDGKSLIGIIIGIKKGLSVQESKAMLVHELSHAVTFWMEEYTIKCDEVRSYTLDYLYALTMQWFDNLDTKKDKQR